MLSMTHINLGCMTLCIHKADLFLLANVKKVCSTFAEKRGRLDLLVLSQGTVIKPTRQCNTTNATHQSLWAPNVSALEAPLRGENAHRCARLLLHRAYDCSVHSSHRLKSLRPALYADVRLIPGNARYALLFTRPGFDVKVARQR